MAADRDRADAQDPRADRPCSRRRSRPGRRGPARHRGRARSRRRAAPTIAAASRASGSPETLAEVVGSGPTAAASARGASWSGTRSPIVGGAAGQRRRAADVGPLRDDEGQAARPEARRRARRGRRPLPDRGRLGGIVEQQHDSLVGRPALGREQALDAAGRRRARRRSRRPCRSAGRRCRRRAGPRPPRPGPPSSSGTIRAVIGRRRRRRLGVAAASRGQPARCRAATVRAGQHQLFDELRPRPRPSSGGRDVARHGAHLGRRARHGRPVADLGEHLEVVPLVADRERRASGHAQPPRQPADGTALRRPRRDELEESRVARSSRRPRPANAARGDRRHDRSGSVGSPTASTFVTGWSIAGDEVRDELRPRAHERGVVVGPRVVGAQDEPLEVVDVRIEAWSRVQLMMSRAVSAASGVCMSSRPRRRVSGAGIDRIRPPW